MSSAIGSPCPDRTVCLNLDRRFEHRDRILKEFISHGIYVEFFLAGDGKTPCYELVDKALHLVPYDHIDVEPGPRSGDYPAWQKFPSSYNANLCFRSIIKKAKEDGIETLLLLEDDATPTHEFEVALSNAWRDMVEADPDWLSLSLGANHTWSKTTLISPHLLLINGSGCWHAICLHRRAFDLILGLPMDGPIDGSFARHIHPSQHSFACWPQAVVTLPGYSYCERREENYNHLFLSRGC